MIFQGKTMGLLLSMGLIVISVIMMYYGTGGFKIVAGFALIAGVISAICVLFTKRPW